MTQGNSLGFERTGDSGPRTPDSPGVEARPIRLAVLLHHSQARSSRTIVNRLDINVIALAASLVLSAGAMAQGMSKSDYSARQDKDRGRIQLRQGRLRFVVRQPERRLVAESEGTEKIARAGSLRLQAHGAEPIPAAHQQGRGRLRSGEGTMRRHGWQRKERLRQEGDGRGDPAKGDGNAPRPRTRTLLIRQY
jgi:hypothetical protein